MGRQGFAAAEEQLGRAVAAAAAGGPQGVWYAGHAHVLLGAAQRFNGDAPGWQLFSPVVFNSRHCRDWAPGLQSRVTRESRPQPHGGTNFASQPQASQRKPSRF
jgi:hypothetical protein